jgi:hypothetical protein
MGDVQHSNNKEKAMKHKNILMMKVLMLVLIFAAYVRSLAHVHNAMVMPDSGWTDCLTNCALLLTMPIMIGLTIVSMMPEIAVLMNSRERD